MSVIRKTTYSSGESLAELLVASLIISLAMIMLFSGVKVGSDIVTNSKDKYAQYYDKLNTYEENQANYIKNMRPPEFYFSLYPHK